MSKKIINCPENCVREAAEGFLAAYGTDYEAVDGVNGLKVRQHTDKVALVIGGGSGHEPMFSFFLGNGLADASANGNIFTSPDPDTIVQTALSVQSGNGVLFVYGNYAGDNMNFDIACEILEDTGIPCRTVRVWDDVASAPADRIEDRRGVAGDLFVIKIAGAATAAGLALKDAWRITSRARDNTWSVGIGLSGATIPGEKAPIFILPEDEIEFGLGIHGEPGIKRQKLMFADEMAADLVKLLLKESGIQPGDEICTCVNGLGSTTLMELCILNRKVDSLLRENGISIYDTEINSYVTTQEMAGASVTFFKLDPELKSYYDMPCSSPYYKKQAKDRGSL